MANYYAKINEDNVVTNVIVANDDHISGQQDSSSYIQTWEDANGDPNKRYNYAAIGMTYKNGAFIDAQPFESWVLDSVTRKWKAPVEKPVNDKFYEWNEATKTWTEVS